MASSDTSHPEKIGKYEIQGVLGRGAMGVVYKGFDPMIERLVAIKTVRADLLVGADGEDWLARFSREARAAGRCLHPNIVALFDYDQHDNMPYIAMEFVEGRELADLFKEGRTFSQAEALDIIRQVLSALDYAHASGIVHRDIKPANIILVGDGSIKVTDFGIARLDTVNLTQHGSMIGTPSYMSPEQFTGQTVDRRSDLFSCGVLLFELLTGEKPFPGTTMTEIMYKVLHEHPREITDVNRLVPAALNDVVRKALAKEAEVRFQHAAEFQGALERALDPALPDDAPAAEEEPDPGATVVVPRPRPAPPRDAPGAPPAPDPALAAGQESQVTERSAIASMVDATLLKQVEDDLAVYMGPIAKILVRKAAKDVETADQLGRRLAGAIPDKGQGEEFLKRVMRTLGQPAPAPAEPAAVPPESPPGGPEDSGVDRSGVGLTGPDESVADASLPGTPLFSKELLKATERGLAEYLGPIAKVLVKKAARRSGSVDELFERLAEHLPSEAERAAFLAGKPET